MMRKIVLAILAILTFTSSAKTYVVSVGICDYADPKVKDLGKCEADARAFGEFYSQGGASVITLLGRQATKRNILATAKKQFGNARKDDKIIFFFSGHGYPGGFCPQDMTGLPDGLTYDEVTSAMKASPASVKMIFADACHSGAIRKEQKVTNPKPGNVLLFLSSRGSEYSGESRFMANGLFTKALLRGLRGAADTDANMKISARELFNYVNNDVKTRTNDRQHPVMWGKFDDNLTIVEYSKK